MSRSFQPMLVPSLALSEYVRRNPKAIDASLERLTCTSAGITDIDIHPCALDTLTEVAPASVVAAVSETLACPTTRELLARLLASEKRQGGARGGTGEPYGCGFNVALALSLHTVLLSRNHLHTILGVVQFRNVVRLSLLGNAVRRVEDCEPLALLPQLAFLSLEFNPVARLPHYRAHVLRICSWPRPLSPADCRLRKLDGRDVTRAEVAAAARALLRESHLLPELCRRVQLRAFLLSLLARVAMHAEQRRLGLLIVDPPRPRTVADLLTHCSAAGAVAATAAQTAHSARLLVRDVVAALKRRAAAHNDSKRPSQVPRRRGTEPPAAGQGAENDDGTAVLECSASTILEVSAVSSLLSRTGADGAGAQAAAEGPSSSITSSLLVSVAQEATRSAGVQQSDDNSNVPTWMPLAAPTVVAEWAEDPIRHAISYVDVQLCSLLVKLGQLCGESLTTSEIDDLLRSWLFTSCCGGVSSGGGDHEVLLREVNVTGRRGFFAPSPGMQHQSQAKAKARAVHDERRPEEDLDNDGDDAHSVGTSSISSVSFRDSDASDEQLPRLSVPTAANRRPTPCYAAAEALGADGPACEEAAEKEDDDAEDVEVAEAWEAEVAAAAATFSAERVASHSPVSSRWDSADDAPPLLPPPVPRSRPATPFELNQLAKLDEREKEEELRVRAYRFDVLRARLFRRWKAAWQRRLDVYRCDRLVLLKLREGARSEDGGESPVRRLLCFSGLAQQLPYRERKRAYFRVWLRRLETRRAEQRESQSAVWRVWKQKTLENRMVRMFEAAVRRRRNAVLLSSTFRWWAERAEGRRTAPAPRAETGHRETRLDAILCGRSSAISYLSEKHPERRAYAPTPRMQALLARCHQRQDDEYPSASTVTRTPHDVAPAGVTDDAIATSVASHTSGSDSADAVTFDGDVSALAAAAAAGSCVTGAGEGIAPACPCIRREWTPSSPRESRENDDRVGGKSCDAEPAGLTGARTSSTCVTASPSWVRHALVSPDVAVVAQCTSESPLSSAGGPPRARPVLSPPPPLPTARALSLPLSLSPSPRSESTPNVSVFSNSPHRRSISGGVLLRHSNSNKKKNAEASTAGVSIRGISTSVSCLSSSTSTSTNSSCNSGGVVGREAAMWIGGGDGATVQEAAVRRSKATTATQTDPVSFPYAQEHVEALVVRARMLMADRAILARRLMQQRVEVENYKTCCGDTFFLEGDGVAEERK